MGYDEKTAGRVRRILAQRTELTERKMFGGLCFLANGAMCCGLANGTLMVRVGSDQYDRALATPHARPMDFTGRPLRGFVYVDPPGIRTDAAITEWIERSLAYISTIPPRKRKPATRRRPRIRMKRPR